MENTEEIYTDFARVYDELMDNTPYEMWCNRLDQLIASYGVSRPTRDAEGILDSERNLVVDLGCGTGTHYHGKQLKIWKAIPFHKAA